MKPERRNKQLRTGRVLTVRCYVRPSGERFYAHCIDLCLSVGRDTLRDAIQELDAMIDSYLAVVNEQGCPRHLLYRRSPLPRRLEYYGIKVMLRILRPELQRLSRRFGPEEFARTDTLQRDIACAA